MTHKANLSILTHRQSEFYQVKLLRPTLPATIEIRQNIETDMDNVLSDPTQIPQIVMNLCTNAAHTIRGDAEVLKVSPPQAELDPDLATIYPDITPGSYLNLTVNDMRHGMTPAIVESVFHHYFTTNTYLPSIQREVIASFSSTKM